MHYKKPLVTSIALTLSLLVFAAIAPASTPDSCKIEAVSRVKQLPNYCGPACLTSVLQHYGSTVTQEKVGKVTFDSATNATNGAEMLYFARQQGFAAYSWNSDIDDIKLKIAAGIPVIVLQQNSNTDKSGHYRVITGFDDAASKFSVMDPYYDSITELSYTQCNKLWKSMGYWALAIMPSTKDTFKNELDAINPVVHMDLSQVLYKHGDFDNAMKEVQLALALEPGNSFATSMVGKIKGALGAGKK